MRSFLCAPLWATVWLCVAQTYAQSPRVETPEANPGRPTVSTPATLTPIGYLQFENGGLYANKSTEVTHRLGINQVTKLTVVPRLQLLVLSEPFGHAAEPIGDALAGNRPGEVFA